MINYADREQELTKLKTEFNHNHNAIFVMAGKAFGITSFLKDKAQIYIGNQGFLSFYVNSASIQNLSENLLSTIIKDPELYATLQKCMDTSYGKKEWHNIMQDVPYIGNTLSTILTSKSSLPLYSGNYASAVEEVLTVFFSMLSRPTVIMIDHAQSLFEDDYSLIIDLITYNHTIFIFAITEQNDSYRKLKNLIFQKSISSSEIFFGEPHKDLVIELGKLFDYSISSKEANQLLISTEFNIHKIIEHFSNPNKSYRLNAVEKSIVAILDILGYPIEKSELFSIIKLCNIYAKNYTQAFDDALQKLQATSIISEKSTSFELNSKSHPEVAEVINSYAQKILYKSAVLKYYKSRGTDFAYSVSTLTLLTSIAYELEDETCETFARQLIKYHLKNGSMIKREIIERAQLKSDSVNDCIVGSIIAANRKKYEDAIEWIAKIDVNANNYIKSYYGILLNRVRRHSEAEIILTSVINNTMDKELGVIVSSYLVSNYVHQEKLNEAQNAFHNARIKYTGTRNLGYLIRNAVSAFEEDRDDLYQSALESFLNANDMFGYYSTLNNQGYHLLNTNPEKGMDLLSKALDNLKLFGENLTQIARNDLGLGHLFMGNYEEAISCFSVVMANESPNMVQLFAKINFACSQLLIGKKEFALKIMNEIRPFIEHYPLDRVRQKYYINRLFIEYYANKNVSEDLIQKAKQYPDRYHPERTEAAISFYMRNKKTKNRKIDSTWKNLYSPCGLAYWVLNPLKIFPEGFIDQIIPV